MIAHLAAAVALLAPGAALGQESAALPHGDPAAEAIIDTQVQPVDFHGQHLSAYHDPWFGGVEFGITSFGYTDGYFAVVDDEVGASFRPYLGYETPEGVGLRGSVFVAAAESTAVDAADASLFTVDIAALSLDIDLYRRLRFQGFDLVIGAGTRGAVYTFERPSGSKNERGAAGGTLFAEGVQPFHRSNCSTWSILGGGRVGLLAGDVTYTGITGYNDVPTSITTGQAYLGIEYRRRLSRGDFLFQVKSDHQIWDPDAGSSLSLSSTGLQVGAVW